MQTPAPADDVVRTLRMRAANESEADRQATEDLIAMIEANQRPPSPVKQPAARYAGQPQPAGGAAPAPAPQRPRPPAGPGAGALVYVPLPDGRSIRFTISLDRLTPSSWNNVILAAFQDYLLQAPPNGQAVHNKFVFWNSVITLSQAAFSRCFVCSVQSADGPAQIVRLDLAPNESPDDDDKKKSAKDADPRVERALAGQYANMRDYTVLFAISPAAEAQLQVAVNYLATSQITRNTLWSGVATAADVRARTEALMTQLEVRDTFAAIIGLNLQLNAQMTDRANKFASTPAQILSAREEYLNILSYFSWVGGRFVLVPTTVDAAALATLPPLRNVWEQLYIARTASYF